MAMRGQSMSPSLNENSPPRSSSNIICISLLVRSNRSLPCSRQRRAITSRTCSGCGLSTTGTPGFTMPALAAAISSSVLPSVFMWS